MTSRHPADIAAEAAIASAVTFSVHFRKGAHETFRSDHATQDEAEAEARRLEAEHGQFGRRAGVYAVTASGRSYLVARKR
jgi:hypothetical protein